MGVLQTFVYLALARGTTVSKTEGAFSLKDENSSKTEGR